MGLRTIALLINESIVCNRQRLEEIRDLLQARLDYDAGQENSCKAIARTHAMIAWLDATLAGKGNALPLSRAGEPSVPLF